MFVVFVQNLHDILYGQLAKRLQMVILRFVTGFNSVVFDGFVNSLVVTWNPSLSGRSGGVMATSGSSWSRTKKNGKKEEEWEEARRNREPAGRGSSKRQNPRCMRVKQTLELFAERILY
ncbi:MAG: hypothetical protein L0387_10270 [Acidobacteria bacterium]|nr:hypothetical protein [Acidobacteriota bacterium]MCI0622041.1 hypothetical protein [Acidobacteriota bacterium]MCI0717993.1 hypothetical protein [Acidobacteriota bacterium]